MDYHSFKNIKTRVKLGSRPSPDLTDKKWQEEFNAMKCFVTPFPANVKKLGGSGSKESGKWNHDTQGKYDGATNWQQYCAYINDVLENIRLGRVDFCYYTYQIVDLLKFHYDTLETKYCEDGYWEVWLS